MSESLGIQEGGKRFDWVKYLDEQEKKMEKATFVCIKRGDGTFVMAKDLKLKEPPVYREGKNGKLIEDRDYYIKQKTRKK